MKYMSSAPFKRFLHLDSLARCANAQQKKEVTSPARMYIGVKELVESGTSFDPRPATDVIKPESLNPLEAIAQYLHRFCHGDNVEEATSRLVHWWEVSLNRPVGDWK